MPEDGKDTVTESPKPEPRVIVQWDRLAAITVVLVLVGLLGFVALIFIIRTFFPW
jgi:hypothetical protein